MALTPVGYRPYDAKRTDAGSGITMTDWTMGAAARCELGTNQQRALLRAARRAIDGAVDAVALLPDELAVRPLRMAWWLFGDGGLRSGPRWSPGEAPLGRELVAAAEGLVLDALTAGLDPARARLHLELVPQRVRLPNFGIKGLFDYRVFEPQLDALAYCLAERRVACSALEAMLANIGPKGIRARLARQLGIDARRMPEYPELVIEIGPVCQLGEESPGAGCVHYERGFERVRPGDVSAAELQRRLGWIGHWFGQHTVAGEVDWRYRPGTDQREDAGRTLARSTMAMWVLNRLARFLDDDGLRALGAQSLRHYLDHYFQIERSLAVGRIEPNPEPLGRGELVAERWNTACFVVLAMVERGETARWADEIELLVRFVQDRQHPSGQFWTRYAQSQYFMPGQAMLCAASLFVATGEARWREWVERSWGAYGEPLRQSMRLGPPSWAPYAPAWFTQPLALMHRVSGEARWLEPVLAINDRVARWADQHRAAVPSDDADGILVPRPGSFGNASITAASLESLVDAADCARRVGDDERLGRYLGAIRRAVALLMRLQYTPANLYWVKNRERSLGGFRTDLLNHTVWMDNVWHLTSAWVKLLELGLLGSQVEPEQVVPGPAADLG